MNEKSSPNISSFVIRFVIESPGSEKSTLPYRGTVRHIQTDEELRFSDWVEVVEFIQNFVPLDDINKK